MFPKKGNVFPNADGEVRVEENYRQTIAVALRQELGGTHRAVKTTMRWTGVSERTAKNWISGSHGPSGEHLISLMRHSDEVLIGLLTLAGRGEAIVALNRPGFTGECFVQISGNFIKVVHVCIEGLLCFLR
jgi:hypothetical protein